MDGSSGKVLISEEEIRQCVAGMGALLSKEYSGRGLTVICVLKGSFLFTADLVRQIAPSIPVEVEFLFASSYGSGTTSSGEVKIDQNPAMKVQDKDVLIVEDILDTGLTLTRIRDTLLQQGARSIKIAVLIDKQTGHDRPVKPDYVGFRIPDRFVIGYGLDLDGRYRNLKEVLFLDGQ